MALYCRTCDLPICNTCSNSSYQGHDCCDLEEQAEVCKTKLKQIHEDTDGLIKEVKRTINKTKRQLKQAGVDIRGIFDNVKSTFMVMHDKLNKEQKEILSDQEHIIM